MIHPYTWITVGVALVLCVIIYMNTPKATRKDSEAPAEGEALEEPQETSSDDQDNLPINPSLSDVKRHFASNSTNEMRFRRVLSNRGTGLDGKSLVCKAVKQENGDPLVFVGEDTMPVAWDKHTRRVAEILTAK